MTQLASSNADEPYWEFAELIFPGGGFSDVVPVGSGVELLAGGTIGSTGVIWRINFEGTRLWSSPIPGMDIGGIALSTAGEIAYVTGRVIAPSWQPTLVLGAFVPDDGGIIALRLFDTAQLGGAITDDRPKIAVASTGDIWVVATLADAVDPTNLRGWLGRFSSTGMLQWSTTYDEGDGADRFVDLALDTEDFVYVVGAHGADAGDADFLVRAYDQSGQVVWTDIIEGAVPWTAERATSVAVASDGIVVAGQVATATGSNWLIRKYAP
jgi:outer membrane protein assembly factor BamB